MKDKQARCESCRFAGWFNGNGEANCKRRAPVAHKDSFGIASREWPQILKTDWCGEFEPKQEEAK